MSSQTVFTVFPCSAYLVFSASHPSILFSVASDLDGLIDEPFCSDSPMQSNSRLYRSFASVKICLKCSPVINWRGIRKKGKLIALVAVIIAVDCARVHSVPSLMGCRYKKDTICFKMVSFFDLLPLASVNKVSVFNDFRILLYQHLP